MLLTKLHTPTVNRSVVHRPDLFDKLNHGLQSKLVMISAPAGFGKTTLVCDWIAQNNIPTAWFSIDRNDNDLVEFLKYIIAGIRNIKPDFGEKALHLLKSPTRPSHQPILNLLINDMIDIQQHFMLVLDDLHAIDHHDIFEALNYLLEYMPANLHIVIITRSDPTLALARLRSQHQLVELRAADLSFTANEISMLFNKRLNTKVSPEDVRTLQRKTEGWIAGLQLAALSMQGRDNVTSFINAFAGNNRYIMDYLIEEVLKVQSDEVKTFLLHTSILEQFSAPLCNAVLGRDDSQKILETLDNTNMFIVPLDAERKWYRYHRLFADLLRQKLMTNHNNEVQNLHIKACDWYEKNQFPSLAIEHALEIQNFEKALILLTNEVEKMWRNGQLDAIVRYGNLFPDTLMSQFPEFSLYFGWILVASGQLQKATPLLTSTELLTHKKMEQSKALGLNTESDERLLGKIAVAFAYACSQDSQPEKAFEYCKTAMQHLDEANPFWYSWAWFSYAATYFAIGSLHESREAFNKAFDLAKTSGNIYLLSTIAIRMAENEQQLGHYRLAYEKCTTLLDILEKEGYASMMEEEPNFAALYFIMGSTHFMWADLEPAFENIKKAWVLSKDVNDIFLRTFIGMAYSVILRDRNEAESDNIIRELEKMSVSIEVPPFVESMMVGWKMYLLSEKGMLKEADQVAKEFGLTYDGDITYIKESAYISLARLLIKQGKLKEAEMLLTRIAKLVTDGQRFERIIEVKLGFAKLYTQTGKTSLALEELMAAMRLVQDEMLLSYFVFNIDEIEGLLQEIFQLRSADRPGIKDNFIEQLKRAIENKKRLRENANPADLSIRELETLKKMAEDLSNQEIADKLFISLNTVKTHLKNIYLKLEVSSRTEAVTKAKALGIL